MACSVPDQFAILILFTIIATTNGFLFGTTPAYEIQSRCPPRSYQEGKVKIFRDKCYNFLMNREVYWDDARDSCIRKGGTMVIINDASTQQFIYTSLKSFDYGNNGIWIGLTDKNHELSWVWANGQPLGHYAYWGLRHGSGVFHQFYDCAYMRYSDYGKWRDTYCNNWPTKYSYICQFDAYPTTTVSTTTTTKTARPPTQSTITTASPPTPSTTKTASPPTPSTTTTASPPTQSTTKTASPPTPSTTTTASPPTPSTTKTASPQTPSTTTASPPTPSTTKTASPPTPSTTTTASPPTQSTPTTA